MESKTLSEEVSIKIAEVFDTWNGILPGNLQIDYEVREEPSGYWLFFSFGIVKIHFFLGESEPMIFERTGYALSASLNIIKLEYKRFKSENLNA